MQYVCEKHQEFNQIQIDRYQLNQYNFHSFPFDEKINYFTTYTHIE
jgi:hypothetical protein